MMMQWKVRPLVKAQDLGRPSTNLQQYPNKDQKKNNRVDTAISNLASTSPPDRLLPLPPKSLFGEPKEQ